MYRILVIDDERPVGETITEMLDASGFEALYAPSGADGLAALETFPADVVLTDIVMPEMDGTKVIERVRAARPAAKIIAMSGGTRVFDVDHTEQAASQGVEGLLSKPFMMKELIDTVRAVLDDT